MGCGKHEIGRFGGLEKGLRPKALSFFISGCKRVSKK